VPVVLRFDAVLEDFRGVSRAIEVREDQTLADLHEGLRKAFGWLDDHLYSFWLDGRFWGGRSTEYTAPFEPDEDVATADVVISTLGLKSGAEIAYVFDFGDNWRVSLRLARRADNEGARYPRVVAAEGDAPPQYPDP
jgi:Plasmid pRiA4b ORF-3-like protein